MDYTLRQIIDGLPAAEWPPLKKARRDFAELQEERRKVDEEVEQLRRTASDLGDVGEALLGANEQIVILTRRRLALQAREQEIRRELIAAVDEKREKFQAEQAAKVAASRDRFVAAVEALRGAHADLVAQLYAAAWLERFPERTGATLLAFVRIAGRRSDPVSTRAVLDALEELAAPPQPPVPVQHVPPGAHGRALRGAGHLTATGTRGGRA